MYSNLIVVLVAIILVISNAAELKTSLRKTKNIKSMIFSKHSSSFFSKKSSK